MRPHPECITPMNLLQLNDAPCRIGLDPWCQDPESIIESKGEISDDLKTTSTVVDSSPDHSSSASSRTSVLGGGKQLSSHESYQLKLAEAFKKVHLPEADVKRTVCLNLSFIVAALTGWLPQLSSNAGGLLIESVVRS